MFSSVEVIGHRIKMLACELAIFIFLSKDTNMDRERCEDVQEIRFGGIWNHLIHIPASSELNPTFCDRLNRFVLFRSIDGWVYLKTCDQVITLGPGFFKHQDVTSMEQIEGRTGEPDRHLL